MGLDFLALAFEPPTKRTASLYAKAGSGIGNADVMPETKRLVSLVLKPKATAGGACEVRRDSSHGQRDARRWRGGMHALLLGAGSLVPSMGELMRRCCSSCAGGAGSAMPSTTGDQLVVTRHTEGSTQLTCDARAWGVNTCWAIRVETTGRGL